MWNLFSERGQPEGNDSSSDSLRQHRFAAQAQRECRRGRGDQSGSLRGGVNVNHDNTEFNPVVTSMKIYLTSCCAGSNIYPVSYVRKDLRTNITLFMHNYFLLDARGEREFDFEPDEFAKSPAVAVKRKRRLWALGRHFLQRRTESVALAKHDDSDRSLLKCDMFS